MKQTAVEWLLDNLIPEPWTEEHFKHNSDCWDQANKLFENQIIDAWNNGYREFYDGSSTPEEYYNTKFIVKP